ncbi:AfsR/SARP family transcriptional regulator, partial [Actinocatenispora thailandica]
PRVAAGYLAAAVGLWRGRVAEDVPAGPVSGPRRAQLAEDLVAAREDLLDARLASGETDGAIRTQLRALVAAEPLRERGWALLLTALARAGDTAGALDAYARARATLVAELGIEPGPELRRLHRAVLDGTAVPSRPAPRPTGLRPAVLVAGHRTAADAVPPRAPGRLPAS